MNSGGHRVATVVVVVTMVFAPVFKHNHWVYTLLGMHKSTSTQRCLTTAEKCAANKNVVKTVFKPLPKNALARCKGHTPCLPKKPQIKPGSVIWPF